MQKLFYKNIINNFIVIRISVIILLLLYTANCIAKTPQRCSAKRETSFDVSVIFNEYRRYYWHYPNTKDAFLTFSENYVTHFWGGLTNRDRNTGTWYKTYKNIEKNKQKYLIHELDEYCIFSNYEKPELLIFTNRICEDCSLENMHMSEFKRHYSLCAFDDNNNILWNHLDSLYQLQAPIQQQINIAKNAIVPVDTVKVKIIPFVYKHSDNSMTFLCDLTNDDNVILNAIEEKVRDLLADYCKQHTEILGINMYIYL